MDKRNKLWRRLQTARVFKARMTLHAACGCCIIRKDGSRIEHPHWFELSKERWTQVYKSTGTPCSCPICKGMRYDRRAFKKETLRMVQEQTE